MYAFERRMQEIERLLRYIKEEESNPKRTRYIDLVNTFIMKARTITFIMQKELKHEVGFDLTFRSFEKR